MTAAAHCSPLLHFTINQAAKVALAIFQMSLEEMSVIWVTVSVERSKFSHPDCNFSHGWAFTEKHLIRESRAGD